MAQNVLQKLASTTAAREFFINQLLQGYMKSHRVTLGVLRATEGLTCHMRLHRFGYRATLLGLCKVTLGYTGLHIFRPSLLTDPGGIAINKK